MIGKDEGEWFDAHMNPVTVQDWVGEPGTVRVGFEDEDGAEYLVDFAVPEDDEQLLAFLERMPDGATAVRLED